MLRQVGDAPQHRGYRQRVEGRQILLVAAEYNLVVDNLYGNFVLGKVLFQKVVEAGILVVGYDVYLAHEGCEAQYRRHAECHLAELTVACFARHIVEFGFTAAVHPTQTLGAVYGVIAVDPCNDGIYREFVIHKYLNGQPTKVVIKADNTKSLHSRLQLRQKRVSL